MTTTRWMVSAVVLMLSAAPALAQTTKPDTSVPSAQNSGAGIPGYTGNKNGPAAKPGTVGSTAGSSGQVDPTVRNQDPSNIKGQPGNKSGPPPVKPR